MQPWKPLLVIVPAGLVLGIIGGKLAHPVMQERASEPWQSMFETRAQRYGTAGAYSSQPQSSIAYVGGYSYPPDTSGWSDAYDPPDWLDEDVPLPTLAELDARQAELLADPDVEFATRAPAEPLAPAVPDESAIGGNPSQVALTPVDAGPEPRTARGKLPAIW